MGDTEYLVPVRRSFDAEWAKQYREGDQQALEAGGVLKHYGTCIQQLSESFGRPIHVLDVGCGTGRYFHCLRNVVRLVGTDLSADMLEQARHPIHADRVAIPQIELKCGDLPALDLAPESFDLIYSVGVYGEYSPLDQALISLFKKLLRPGGKFFVTAVDATSRISVPETGRPSLVRRVLRKSWGSIPPALRARLNHRLSPFYVTNENLEKVFQRAGLASYEIQPYVHTSGWLGTHLDCLGVK